jgi:exodeoxyribonuclease-3
MRIMSWNILVGGQDRLDAIVTVLRRERPDLLALQELRGFDRRRHERMRTLADAVGMTPHLARSIFGQPVAVLVRPPLRIARHKSYSWQFHHAAAAVTLTDGLTFVSTHLNPYSGYRRYREATWLAARFRGPVVIAGDMNSLDPHTDHSAALAGLPVARRHLRSDGTVDTRAIAAYERAGLRDLWRTAGAGEGLTVPTTIGGHEFGPMRLDYLLATPAVAGRVREMRVLRDDQTAKASDHFPVRADL